ncbi:MAG TPA: hypothetical protein VHI93_07920 [Candidatus Thermoplasmatota archaeon]|nr:hypothetical protein [Candidatus Thermoplasmatota archaeon]
MAETATLLAPANDASAELRREQERLAKLWQAFKAQEDELEHLRKERFLLKEALAEQERAIAGLREEQATLRQAATHKELHEEAERRNRVLLVEVEGLHRDLRAATERTQAAEADLLKEQERLAKLFKVYEEQQQELAAARARLDRWESWFSRMEPAIVALPKFFADAPRA